MTKGKKEFYQYAGWVASASYWAGVTAEVIPLRTDTEPNDEEKIDAIIFSGGADISEHWYGGATPNYSNEAIPLRDRVEAYYFNKYRGKIPILGICRGMQLINCLMGGTLIQDLKESEGYFPHVEGEHKIFFTDGRECITNSYHHQSVDQLGHGLSIIAKAGDGVVEMAQAPGIYLVQFHPERQSMCWDNLSNEIFTKLL